MKEVEICVVKDQLLLLTLGNFHIQHFKDLMISKEGMKLAQDFDVDGWDTMIEGLSLIKSCLVSIELGVGTLNLRSSD